MLGGGLRGRLEQSPEVATAECLAFHIVLRELVTWVEHELKLRNAVATEYRVLDQAHASTAQVVTGELLHSLSLQDGLSHVPQILDLALAETGSDPIGLDCGILRG